MKTENLIYLVDSESLSVINSYSSIEEASEDTLIGIEQIKYSLDNHVKIEDSWYFVTCKIGQNQRCITNI